MTAKTKAAAPVVVTEDVIRRLAAVKIHYAVVGGDRINCTVRAGSLVSDSRSRSGVWRKLIADGYLADATPGKVSSDSVATVTDKAMNAMPSDETFELASLYKYDGHQDRKCEGNAVVRWDDLTVQQRLTVVRAVKADPARYTLLAYTSQWQWSKCPFALGEGYGAMDEVNGDRYDAVLGVTDDGVRSKRLAAARLDYKKDAAPELLESFLRKQGVLEVEESLPLAEKMPMFGNGVSIPRDPKAWPEGVREAIGLAKKKILDLRARIAIFEKFESHAEAVGGWEAFLAGYDASVEAYIDRAFAGKQV